MSTHSHFVTIADQTNLDTAKQGVLSAMRKARAPSTIPVYENVVADAGTVAWRLVSFRTEQPRLGALISGTAQFDLRQGE